MSRNCEEKWKHSTETHVLSVSMLGAGPRCSSASSTRETQSRIAELSNDNSLALSGREWDALKSASYHEWRKPQMCVRSMHANSHYPPITQTAPCWLPCNVSAWNLVELITRVPVEANLHFWASLVEGKAGEKKHILSGN